MSHYALVAQILVKPKLHLSQTMGAVDKMFFKRLICECYRNPFNLTGTLTSQWKIKPSITKLQLVSLVARTLKDILILLCFLDYKLLFMQLNCIIMVKLFFAFVVICLLHQRMASNKKIISMFLIVFIAQRNFIV